MAATAARFSARFKPLNTEGLAGGWLGDTGAAGVDVLLAGEIILSGPLKYGFSSAGGTRPPNAGAGSRLQQQHTHTSIIWGKGLESLPMPRGSDVVVLL